MALERSKLAGDMSRVRAAAERLWTEQRSDLLLALALAVFAALDVLLSSDWRGPAVVNAIVVPAMALTLIWRRQRPLLVLAAVIAGVAFLSLAYGTSETWSYIFITAIAVYSAAAHGSRPLVALSLVAAGVVLADLRDPQIHTFGDAVWSSALLGLAFLAGLTGLAFHARSRAVEERAMRLEEQEDELAAAAAERERERIARELHDIVSHSLGVMVLQAGAAEQVVGNDPERARGVLRSIRATGQDAVAEMTTLLGLVRGESQPSRTPQPSLGDLGQLVENTRDAGLPVELTIDGESRPLPAALELSAFRIVQEGLTNALKHSGRSPTRVALHYGERDLEIEIADEGEGSPNGRGSRRGLAGIAERVAVFGGRLDAGPRPGGGWLLRATLPLAR